MLQIPFSPNVSADLVQRVDLAGQFVTMRMVFNIRSQFWFLHLTNDLGKQLGSLKVVPNYPLLSQYKSQKPITGDLLCLPVDDAATWPPEYADIGLRWFIFWVSDEEAEMWRVKNGLG